MELTKNQKIMKFLGLAYAVMFAGTALVFIVMPGQLFGLLNGISRTLFPSLPLASDSGKFWVALTVSMMVTITVLSFFIYKDVRTNYRMAIPLVAAKITSSLFGIIFFLAGFFGSQTGWDTLANLIIAVTDFPLGVIMFVLYKLVHEESSNE